MDNWEKYPFEKTIIRNKISRENQINASQIKTKGKFPVIDQGQDYIAGYTDEYEKVVKEGFPYVIFGDHTRCFKFVDFPFLVGADGTKVFSPNKELFDPKFYYFQLLSLSIRSRGYNRHFKLLKEKYIEKPPISEQQKISYILTIIQEAIEKQEQLIKTTTELKKALMQKLFTEGLRGEKQKKTEIGLVPESWEVVTIGDIYKFTAKPKGLIVKYPVHFVPMELIPLDKIYIESFQLRDKVSSGTYVENGDLLLAKITPSFENGKQGILNIKENYGYATTEVIPIKEIKDVSDKFYLFYYLLKDDIRKQLTDKMEGSTGRQRLSKSVLRETLIPKTSIEEQVEISKVFFGLDNKISICNNKKQILTDLFKTLLHQLMTGQISVDKVEFKEYQELSKVAESKEKYS